MLQCSLSCVQCAPSYLLRTCSLNPVNLHSVALGVNSNGFATGAAAQWRLPVFDVSAAQDRSGFSTVLAQYIPATDRRCGNHCRRYLCGFALRLTVVRAAE